MIVVTLLLAAVLAKDGGWTEQSDGTWVNAASGEVWGAKDGGSEDGATKDETSTDQKKYEGCTNTGQGSALDSFPRTCITSATDVSPGTGPRCWWTHKPTATKSTIKVPLVIDMHGGGGCASHQLLYSGFKELSDTLGSNSFIVVYPQGANSLWGSCGSEPSKCTQGGKKDMATWDDIGFLEQMIANIIKSQPVDPERVYLTGFSLGCMMAHRFAMERGKLVAGLGCHGGELSGVGKETTATKDALKTQYNIQPMPVYNTGGSADAWITNAGAGEEDFNTWLYWNECKQNTTKSITLTGEQKTAAVERVGSSCASYAPALETKFLLIDEGIHAPDSRMAKRVWEFLSEYKREGAAAQLPSAVAEINPKSDATADLANHAPRCGSRVAWLLLVFSMSMSLTGSLVAY